VITTDNNVTVIGHADLPSRLPTVSSQFYANNILALLTHIGGTKDFKLDGKFLFKFGGKIFIILTPS